MLLLPLVLQVASAATTLDLSLGVRLGVTIGDSQEAHARSEDVTVRSELGVEAMIGLEAELDPGIEASLP